jgi:ribonuclease PH
VASITGAFVALALALERLCQKGFIQRTALVDYVAAVSVGIVNGDVLLDLNYVEDSAAEVDMNVVITGDGGIVEVQGTAEAGSFSRGQLDELLDLAQAGIQKLVDIQREALSRTLGENSSFLQSQDVALSSSHSE